VNHLHPPERKKEKEKRRKKTKREGERNALFTVLRFTKVASKEKEKKRKRTTVAVRSSGVARTWRRDRLPIPREYRSIEIDRRADESRTQSAGHSNYRRFIISPVNPPRAAPRYYYHYHYFGSTVIALSAASMSQRARGVYSLRVKAARHTCAISPLSRCLRAHILSRSIGERARPLADIQFSAALAGLGAPPSARERERNRERERERSSVNAEKLSSAERSKSKTGWTRSEISDCCSRRRDAGRQPARR